MHEQLIKTPEEPDNIFSNPHFILSQKLKNSTIDLFRLIIICLTLAVSLTILSTAAVKYKQVNNSCNITTTESK